MWCRIIINACSKETSLHFLFFTTLMIISSSIAITSFLWIYHRWVKKKIRIEWVIGLFLFLVHIYYLYKIIYIYKVRLYQWGVNSVIRGGTKTIPFPIWFNVYSVTGIDGNERGGQDNSLAYNCNNANFTWYSGSSTTARWIAVGY